MKTGKLQRDGLLLDFLNSVTMTVHKKFVGIVWNECLC